MGVDLAAPGLLAGLLLLALPILAHLTGYQEVRAVRFPTLRFLRASQQKVRRRTRFESWLLLLLRLLAVAALVVLFARPTLTWTASALAGTDPSRPTVILLDRSASMHAMTNGTTTAQEARRRAMELLGSLEAGTPAAVIAFASRPEVLGLGLTDAHAGLRAGIEGLLATAEGTDLGGALARARDLLRDEGVAAANVVVLSDGLGTVPSGLSAAWPEAVTVHYHDLLGRPLANRFPDSAKVTSAAGRGAGIRIETEVRAVGPAPRGALPLRLTLSDAMEVVGDVRFEGAEVVRRLFTLAVPPSGTLQATLSLPPDDLPIDDVLPFTLAGETDLSVLLVSGDGGSHPQEDEVYYLSRALEPGAGSLSRVRPRQVSAEELRRIDGGRGDVVVLANVADPRPLAGELEAFVTRGGGLLISVGPRVDPDLYRAALPSLLPSLPSEVKTRGRGTFEQSPVGLALPPLDRDAFRVFRTGGAAAFGTVRFGKVLGVDPALQPDSEVVLRYSDGLPALLERRVGEGRVLLFTSTLDDDWTDLPLRSIYVPLMHQLVRSLSDTLLLEGAALVDAGTAVTLPVPPDPRLGAWVVGPGAEEQPVATATADAEGNVGFLGTSQAGHYALLWGTGAGGEGVQRTVFSVRVPREESFARRMDRAALLAAVPGLVLHDGAAGGSRGDDEALVVRRASLGPALLGLLGLALLGEGLLGGRRS